MKNLSSVEDFLQPCPQFCAPVQSKWCADSDQLRDGGSESGSLGAGKKIHIMSRPFTRTNRVREEHSVEVHGVTVKHLQTHASRVVSTVTNGDLSPVTRFVHK